MSVTRSILWRETAARAPAFPPLMGDVTADVAVIGCGIMGAVTALALASRGVSVVVLEAQCVAEGSSSRSGGFVVPTFSFGGPRQVIDAMGDAGVRLVQATGSAANRVFDLVRKHNISCDALQSGWYQPAHDAASWQRVQTIARQWESAGFPVELLDADETYRRTGIAGYHGSWSVRTGGTLHPANYTFGLAEAAVRSGARIFERSSVRSITRRDGKLVLQAAGGRVIVERAVLCTNGRSGGPYAALERSILPMKVWQCATEPIAPAARAHLFSRGECLSDTRANLFTYRFDRDWRLITGILHACGMTPGIAARLMAQRLQKRLSLAVAPRLGFVWSGVTSVTRTRWPQLSVFEDGVIAAVACNGRGIALSTMVGEAIAQFVASGSASELPLPVTRPVAAGAVRLQKMIAPLYPYYGLIKDWADVHRSVPISVRKVS